jgi:hypothetical protein
MTGEPMDDKTRAAFDKMLGAVKWDPVTAKTPPLPSALREHLSRDGTSTLVWTEHEVDITRPRSKTYRRAQWNAICVERGINNIPDRDGVYRRAVAYWHEIARKSK